MQMEVSDQLDNGNFLLTSKVKCQKGRTNLPKVRQMKCREDDGSRGSTTVRQIRRLSPGPQQAYSLRYHSNKDQASYVYSALMIPPWLVRIDPEIDQVIQNTMDTKLEITVDGETQDFLGANNGRQSDGRCKSHDPYSKQGHFSDIILYSTTGFARIAKRNCPELC